VPWVEKFSPKAPGRSNRSGRPGRSPRHAAAWSRADLPGLPDLLERPGAFGENFSTHGLTEHDVCVGDLWRVGSALLQVSQARQPCFKLNLRFGVPT
jgi:MOSC domain-containing protein YiiM